jgi:hypothetical protein
VTGEEVYGNSPGSRADLEARQLGDVLAVARDHRVGFGGVSHRVDALLASVAARAWQCVSGCDGRSARAFGKQGMRRSVRDPGRMPDGWRMTSVLATGRMSAPIPKP